MEGWKKLVAGALIGVAGTVYATDEEARRNLPRSARDLPDNVRRRFKDAVAAGREASSRRRQEILSDLAGHGGGGGVDHRPRRDAGEPVPDPAAYPVSPEPAASGDPVERTEDTEPTGATGATASAGRPPAPEGSSPALDDSTEPIDPEDAREAAAQKSRPEGG
ncbi:hypothetical protein [Rubrobacter aplysinae]|uniref:hypothetical protein n=1 Tax=Rubrobacter aplysinae TaxID=909625 RepID=UPI00064BC43F|nr:hypothetical protein [Rubrobacter aplysinae]